MRNWPDCTPEQEQALNKRLSIVERCDKPIRNNRLPARYVEVCHLPIGHNGVCNSSLKGKQ